ncbi:MAG: GDSL-type esterase/lipase family protein [Gammaproteobacteria bacterium]
MVAVPGAGDANAAPLAPSGLSLTQFAVIGVQLALVMLLLRQFQIESAAFLRLAALAFAGFAVHAFLPLRHRLPFFVALSVGSIFLVMGWANGAWLVAISLLLIGICHLPASFNVRIGLLLVTGSILIAQRAGALAAPWSPAIWPILGSIFMFRLLVYVYDLKHEKSAGTWAQRLGYFFMLPNACFPLFPVIDYKTFRTHYFDDDAYRTYQVGVDWIVRGVIHLLLYRVFYYHLTLAPHEVADPATLLQFLVANFMLYLRVSGLFHLIVGMLHLFGFRLPETHNRYLLASSFTDFWRRINIYWKDFMQKLFFYPVAFRLRRLGTQKVLVIATLYVFVMTWFLHAYQWFWLRGTMLLVWQDVLFWAVLGVLVVVNSLYEVRYGRKRSLGAQTHNWRTTATLILKSYLTFWFIVVLWSFWTSENLHDWFSIWAALGGEYALDSLLFPVLVLIVIVLGTVTRDDVRNVRASQQSADKWLRERAVTVVALVVLIAISIEGVATRIHPELATFVHSLRSGQLSRLDTAKLERGYYESLLAVDSFNSQLWEVYTKKPANWLDVDNANLKRFVPGYARNELIPSFVSNTRYGTISINRWGMRDQDYAEAPPPDTFRFAVLGASSVMGWGVGDGETFEALVESRLNAEQPIDGITGFESLNMGIPGYDPPQQLLVLPKALDFAPDAVLFVATGRELSRAARSRVSAVRDGLEVPFPSLAELLATAGVQPDMDEASAMRALAEHEAAILAQVYTQFVEQCRRRGATPVWVFLPQVRSGSWEEETAAARAIAAAAGFVIIDMADVYHTDDYTTLRLAEWDDHPNRRGHELVAERLYRELLAQRDAIFSTHD